METITWNIIDKYFKDNPYNLVAHHLDSYNDFVTKGLFQVFKDNNPIRFIERDDSENIDSDVRNEALLYLGGKNGDKIYFGMDNYLTHKGTVDCPELKAITRQDLTDLLMKKFGKDIWHRPNA